MGLTILSTWLVFIVTSLGLGYKMGRIGVILNLFVIIYMNISLIEDTVWDVVSVGSEIIIELWTWVDLYEFEVSILIYNDMLNFMMLVLVVTVSSLIHLYSLDYMKQDPSLNRFISYLSIFTMFMLVLIYANNLVILFIGWEGVGISSFLLISFWNSRYSAAKAAVKAMVVNRIGDVFMLIAIVMSLYYFGTTEIGVLKNCIECFSYVKMQSVNVLGYSLGIVDVVGLTLFMGAMAKSAQIGLHVWLPDAMEGPTPVSALIHAATMVTAGVFLLIRMSFLVEYSEKLLVFIVFIGSVTAFMASLQGLVNYDIKKVVAYSTCSQLGYMFMSCGVSNYLAGFFHLFNHGFFKALLFLSMGSVIHGLGDEQDMRKMGGMFRGLPLTFFAILIGSYALLGLPYLTGFYSKDLLLEMAFVRLVIESYFVQFLGLLAAFLTAFYSTRLMVYIFFADFNGNRQTLLHLHESGRFMFLALCVLSVGSIFLGYLCSDLVVGIGSLAWKNVVYLRVMNYSYFDVEFNYTLLEKLAPLYFSILGILLYVFLYEKIKSRDYTGLLTKFMGIGFGFDYIYNKIFLKGLVNNVNINIYKFVEKDMFEFMGGKSLMFTYVMLAQMVRGTFNYMYVHLGMLVFIIIGLFLVFRSADYMSIELLLVVVVGMLYLNENLSENKIK